MKNAIFDLLGLDYNLSANDTTNFHFHGFQIFLIVKNSLLSI